MMCVCVCGGLVFFLLLSDGTNRYSISVSSTWNHENMKAFSVLFCALLFICGVLSQEGAGGQQQEINRETIEAIMNAVSPGCRNEMESAIQSQSDVSPDCKLEIQQAVRRYCLVMI
jgi:hypothetical protein